MKLYYLTPIFAAAINLVSIACQASEVKYVDPGESSRIFPSDVEVKTLASDLQFTEGPVWFGGREGYLVFSDIPADHLLKWTEEGGLETFRDPSENTNGNTLDLQGRLISCEHGGRKVSLQTADGKLISLISQYQGKKFNSPNDAVVKSDGTIWFTDPDYGLGSRPKEQAGNYVYRFDPLTQVVTAVATDFNKPNGLCFSPDESQLYIADSGSPKHIRSFLVDPDGTLSDGKIFAKLDVGGPDGIRCDFQGRVWSSSGDGVQVFNPDGTLIARILLPKGAANLCFGGANGRTLFMTARDQLHSVETLVNDATYARSFGMETPARAPRNAMRHPDSSQWVSLFDDDLSNAIAPKGVWTSENGVFTASEDQALWTPKDYENFVLDLEFKNGPGANSGVVIYCTDTKDWIPNSVEVQIADDFADQWAKADKTWQCGAIFGHLAASTSNVNPAGEWNRYSIRCVGKQIDVVLNGQHVTSMDMSLWKSATKNPDGSGIPPWLSKPYAGLPTKGKIGLQGKHAGAPIWFRNVKIQGLDGQ